MEEMAKHGRIGLAAMRAGVDPKTARKYFESGELPSGVPKGPRDYRTRPDPFEEDWPEVEQMLELEPTLEALTVFEFLLERQPGRYQEGQLRTLQRRFKQWRAMGGPDKEVFFPQEHRAGEALQTDFTWTGELGITIGGVPFPHLLCHTVLPYSNWESVTVSDSESMEAIKRGVQTALFRLGQVPSFHQTDHSTAATHHVLGTCETRRFNEEYSQFCAHFGMTPRTTALGAKEQNGDVESLNGVFKRRVEQRLLLRGSRDFESTEFYEQWLWQLCQRFNSARSKRLGEEIEEMRPLVAERLVEWKEIEVRVTTGSTVRVKNNTYSVPARLIGERVRVRIHERWLEIFYGGKLQMKVGRMRGEGRARIQYRHVIDSLLRKPGAFTRYRHREELFPSVVFRAAYDRLFGALTERKADIEYLRILHLAATTTEASVQKVLEAREQEGTLPLSERVREATGVDAPVVPDLASPPVCLSDYDELLKEALSV